MSLEDYEKREWTTRAALMAGQYIVNFGDLPLSIVGVSIYDADAGQTCYVSLLAPDGSIMVKDAIQDIKHDLEEFEEMCDQVAETLDEFDAVVQKK